MKLSGSSLDSSWLLVDMATWTASQITWSLCFCCLTDHVVLVFLELLQDGHWFPILEENVMGVYKRDYGKDKNIILYSGLIESVESQTINQLYIFARPDYSNFSEISFQGFVLSLVETKKTNQLFVKAEMRWVFSSSCFTPREVLNTIDLWIS